MLNRLRSWKSSTRWIVIVALCLAATAAVAMLKPIPQPPSYHDFADQRTIFGIARGIDVLSNAAFLVPGLLGLWFVLRAGKTLDAGTRWAFAILFIGLALT